MKLNQDQEYIEFQTDDEFINCIAEVLSCDKCIAERIFDEVEDLQDIGTAHIRNVVQFLVSKNVTVSSIQENAFLLGMSIGSII